MALGELAAGTLFARDYRIVRPLSTGGMGAVYVAEQLSTNKERALKLMRPELVSNPDLRRRFEQEARVSAKIASDHVVEIVGAGVDEPTGMPWLAMELLEGEELFERAEREGALDVETVRAMFEQLCHALGAAHAQKIVHRDMKPENVFLATARRPGVPFTVKVLDFGIAKTLADADARATASMGTPLWMAPEQTQQGAAITPAADVWALGLIAFRLLTGRYYWRAAYDEARSTTMLLREVLIDPMVPASARAAEYGAPALPAGFDAWFARATARDPAERYADASALYRDLAPLLGGVAPASAAFGAVAPSAGATRVSGGVSSAPFSQPAGTEMALASTAYATPLGPSESGVARTGAPLSPPGLEATPVTAHARSSRAATWLVLLAGAAIVLALGVVIGLRHRRAPARAYLHHLAIPNLVPAMRSMLQTAAPPPPRPIGPPAPPGPDRPRRRL